MEHAICECLSVILTSHYSFWTCHIFAGFVNRVHSKKQMKGIKKKSQIRL